MAEGTANDRNTPAMYSGTIGLGYIFDNTNFHSLFVKTPRLSGVLICAEHGAILGGENPLHAVEVGSASLGKGVHREVKSEGSR